MRTSRGRPAESGVALITTIIILTVMAVVAVALMQGVTGDRYSARSVANYTRAKLAAEAGLSYVAASLGTNTTNDTFIVVLNTNRQLFVGNGSTNTATSSNFVYTPLFSTVSNVSTPVSPVVTALLPTTNVSGGILFTNRLAGGLSVTSPAVTWVYMTYTNFAGATVTNARFAYWLEDLGGRLDLSVAGTNTGAPEARRPTGTNPSEIALWAAFTNAVSATESGGAGDILVGNRSNILTPATARLVDGSVTNNNLLADLTANLRHDTNEPEVIPFGFGYADQGRAKYNLNTNASAGDLPNIVFAITNNLRNPTNAAAGFASTSRSGGMSGDRYVNAIAASMIDYVDSDNAPTTGGSGSTAYRGIEALPFVTETATAIQWVDHSANLPGFTGRIADEIHVENFVELWNPSDRAFSGIVEIVFSNDYACGSVNGFNIDLRITNSGANSSITNTLGFSNNVYFIAINTNYTTPNGTIITNNPTLGPNEYRAFSLGTNIYRFVVSNNPNAEPLYSNNRRANAGGSMRLGAPPSGTSDSFASSLSLRLNGLEYDRVANIHRVGNRTLFCRLFSTGSDALPDWAGNVPALRMTPTESPALPGDPRMGFYLTSTNNAQGYASTPANPGSSMGFRNNGTSSRGTLYNTEPSRWLDGGFTNSPLRSATITDAIRPQTNRQTTNHSTEFVQPLNNTGTWTNILELGNIFDPVAWNATIGSAFITAAMTPAGNGSSSTTFGGGNTLRIGRAEHPRFTNDGLRASQLLDVFAVGAAAGGIATNRVAGRVNLNTAGTNVLRALAAGVQHSLEPSMRPSNLVVPVNAVNAFVSGVTNFRSQRPFYSTSQLNLISTNTNAATWTNGTVFGRTNLLGATSWGDRGAEEWFSRVYPLSTVRSRNFLVHVVGQSVATNNPTVPLSTARRVFQIYLEPTRGANGLTTNSTARILGTWDL